MRIYEGPDGVDLPDGRHVQGIYPSESGAPFRTLGDLLEYERRMAPRRRREIRRALLIGLLLGSSLSWLGAALLTFLR